MKCHRPIITTPKIQNCILLKRKYFLFTLFLFYEVHNLCALEEKKRIILKKYQTIKNSKEINKELETKVLMNEDSLYKYMNIK